MKHYRLVGLGLAMGLGIAAQSLVGRSQAQNTSAPVIGPFDSLHFRPLGPASMSGRIADIAVYEANPAVFYVATAHGGVWKTVNNGTTFAAQMQDRGLMSIGDVEISQSNPDLVWVGTGESNNRQSTSWGDGVYKSTDGGKSYSFMGLRTSRHINRIAIDPRNTETVFVAATGSLWGSGGERGVYKTTDGGKVWTHVLKVDDDTGANDLVIDPANTQVLYASTYQRRLERAGVGVPQVFEQVLEIDSCFAHGEILSIRPPDQRGPHAPFSYSRWLSASLVHSEPLGGPRSRPEMRNRVGVENPARRW